MSELESYVVHRDEVSSHVLKLPTRHGAAHNTDLAESLPALGELLVGR
jgi:hypothetical protein